MSEEQFRFKLHEWRAACTIPDDFIPPSDAYMEMVVDPSYTANEGSDHSAIVGGYKYQREDCIELNLLHAVSGQWKGLKLVDAILDAVEIWKPEKITIERSSGSSCDLLVDVLRDRAKARDIVLGFISTPPPSNKKQKRNRIRRLQSLFETTPPAIRMKYTAFINRLSEEVEKFLYERQDNKGRPDDLLDALATLAGF